MEFPERKSPDERD